ncbi:GDP-Man:Man(3)GlcNAc(2)-PP-Dol alpha-1,2-mannosyltransferase, partial [Fragariocoptes setiger]
MSMIVVFILTALVLAVSFAILKLRRTPYSIAFFHPYCAAGGGGERVMWCAIKSLHKRYPHYNISVYTGDSNILSNVEKTFGIQFDRPIRFVHLKHRWLLDASRYPVMTLLFQSVGSLILSLEAILRFVPEIYIDSMGFSWTLPIFRILGCSTVSYVHYPFISTDMIESVSTSDHESFNNRKIFAQSPTLKFCKLLYYRSFAWIYGYFGRLSHVVMVNSTWTKRHIEKLWVMPTSIVYPPCNVESFKSLPLDRFNQRKTMNIISIAQFRPEKNHELQLEAFRKFITTKTSKECMFYLYGGCRDHNDRARVQRLKDLATSLEIRDRVTFTVGAPFEEILRGVEDADIAMHSMINEHFGIVLVECMAAGLILLAHKSGGPKDDIIEDGINGFLASDTDEFASKLAHIYELPHEKRMSIRVEARKRSNDFSDESFETNFLKALEGLLRCKRY